MKDLKTKFLKLLANNWPILLIVAFVGLFFWKFFLLDMIPLPGDFVLGTYFPWLDYKWGYAVGVPVKNPIMADVVSFSYPMRVLAIDLIKSGQLPLWNPYILSGVPLLANFQSAPYTLTNIVYFIFNTQTAWGLQVVLQHLLAAIFTYILLRYWKVSKFGAVLGGTIFAFSGFNLIWSQWNAHTLVAAFIPVIIYFADRFLQEGKVLFGFFLSIFIFLQILAGYPQVTLYTLLTLALLFAVRVFSLKNNLPRLLLFGVFTFLGVLLASFQLLPGVELIMSSQRSVEAHPFEWAFLPLSKIITFVAPDYFGNHATANYWGPQDYTSNTGFVGVVALVLAMIGAISFKKNRKTLFPLSLLTVSLLLSFATPVSIFLWKSGFLGLQAASAHRALVLFNLAVALLAGFGVDAILKKKANVVPPLLIVGTLFSGYLLVSATGYYKYIPNLSDPIFLKIGIRNLVFPGLIFLGLSGILFRFSVGKYKRLLMVSLTLLMIAELFRFGWKFTPFVSRSLVFPQTPALKFLGDQEKPYRLTGSNVTPINMLMPYNIERLEGYDAIYPESIGEFVGVLNSGLKDPGVLRRYAHVDKDTSKLLDLVNTKYYLALKTDEKGDPDPAGTINDRFLSERFVPVFEDKSIAVLKSVSALPRAFVVYDWDVLENKIEMADKLLHPDFTIDTKILLEKKPPIQQDSVIGVYTAKYTSYKEQSGVIEVNTNKPGMLFISDLYYPGWRALVDGEEVEIFKANLAFRAISLSEGKHEVYYEYKPASFLNGLKISAGSLFLLLSIYVGRGFFEKKF